MVVVATRIMASLLALLAAANIARTVAFVADVWFDPANPFARYYADGWIRMILGAGIAVDLLVMALFVAAAWRWHHDEHGTHSATRMWPAAVAVGLLPGLEVLRAATFYYGEVADKQALWLAGNHFGAIGSVLALVIAISLLILRRGRSGSEELMRPKRA